MSFAELIPEHIGYFKSNGEFEEYSQLYKEAYFQQTLGVLVFKIQSI